MEGSVPLPTPVTNSPLMPQPVRLRDAIAWGVTCAGANQNGAAERIGGGWARGKAEHRSERSVSERSVSERHG